MDQSFSVFISLINPSHLIHSNSPPDNNESSKDYGILSDIEKENLSTA